MADDVELDYAVVRPPKRVRGRMPLNAPITALGLTRQGADQLTDAAKKLKKSDLILLREDLEGGKALGLSARDINSIRGAFSVPIDIGLGRQLGGAASFDISCCCCTPCCCAAAALETQRPVA